MQLELIQTIVFFLAGSFLIFLAFAVTRENLASVVNRAAGILLFFAGVGPLTLALGQVIQESAPGAPPFEETILYNLHYLWEFFFPAVIMFSLAFPLNRLARFKHPRLRPLVLVPQALHLLLAVFYLNLINLLDLLVVTSEGDGFGSMLLRPFAWGASQVMLMLAYVHTHDVLIFGSINLIYLGVAAFLLEIGRRAITNPQQLTQARIVIWALRLGLGFYLLSFLSLNVWQASFGTQSGTYLLMIAVITGGGIFTYAIVRHQFLSVQLFFRQSLINTLLSALLVGLYVVAGIKGQRLLEPIFGARAEVISYIVIVFMLLLFQPTSTWVDNVIRSMFMRTRTDYRYIVERFSRDVISVFDPRQLRTTIEETLKTRLLVDRVYFILYDDTVGEYAILPSEDSPRRVVIDREDLLLRGINLLDSPTRYNSLEEYQEGSRLATIMAEWNLKIILPMKDADHLLGFLALSSKTAGYSYTAEDFNLLGVLSNQMVTALTNARLYADSLERSRLQEEVSMARQIQIGLLPSKPPDHPKLLISASSTPSRTVGGDFYDFIPIQNRDRLGIVIGDASGKGMPAALMVTQIQAILRSEVNNGNPIQLILKNMNQHIATSTSSEKYVTLFYAEFEQATSTLHYANAGHNYPLLIRADGSLELLVTGGPIIGAFGGIEYESDSVVLRQDDLLFFFTDGLSEAMDQGGAEYGEERIRRFVTDCRTKDPQTIMEDIISDVRAYDPTTPPQDDTTIIAIKMTNGQMIDG